MLTIRVQMSMVEIQMKTLSTKICLLNIDLTMTTIKEKKGQMLVEVEPIRYELHSIKFINSWKEEGELI